MQQHGVLLPQIDCLPKLLIACHQISPVQKEGHFGGKYATIQASDRSIKMIFSVSPPVQSSLHRKRTTLKVSRSVAPMRCGLRYVYTLHRGGTLTST